MEGTDRYFDPGTADLLPLITFSTGGAILMSNCADDKTRAKLPTMQLGLAVGSLIFAIVLCLVGFVGIF